MTAPRIMVALFGPPGQGSFNESGYDGAMRARAAGHAVEVHWIAPLAAHDRAEALRTLCKQSPDLLVAHGGQGDEPVKLIHQEFPETVFAITQGVFSQPIRRVTRFFRSSQHSWLAYWPALPPKPR